MNLALAAGLAGGCIGLGLWVLIGALALPFRPRLADALDLLDGRASGFKAALAQPWAARAFCRPAT